MFMTLVTWVTSYFSSLSPVILDWVVIRIKNWDNPYNHWLHKYLWVCYVPDAFYIWRKYYVFSLQCYFRFTLEEWEGTSSLRIWGRRFLAKKKKNNNNNSESQRQTNWWCSEEPLCLCGGGAGGDKVPVRRFGEEVQVKSCRIYLLW